MEIFLLFGKIGKKYLVNTLIFLRWIVRKQKRAILLQINWRKRSRDLWNFSWYISVLNNIIKSWSRVFHYWEKALFLCGSLIAKQLSAILSKMRFCLKIQNSLLLFLTSHFFICIITWLFLAQFLKVSQKNGFGNFSLKITLVITLDRKVLEKEALPNQKPGNT